MDKYNVLLLSHGMSFRDQGVLDVHKVSDEIRLLIFGQVRRYKGVLEFIRIIKEIDMVHLTIAGECKDVLLDKEISTLVSLSHNITYSNSYLESSELDDLLKTTDVAVFPYVKITTSGAVYKALEHRKIILTSDLPYFLELRDKGLVNFCYSTSDISSLNAFLDSLRSKTWKERRDLSHLSWMNIVKRYLDAGAIS
ncbi:glycosyltransferase [Schleiferiaceae bacterium]|nr:glycosyltransferase [Schleiferiaceae bacterium]